MPMQPQVPTMKSWYVSLCLLSLLWQYQDSHPLPLRLISRTRGRSIFYSLSAGIITNPEGEQPFGRSIQEVFTRNPNDSTINTPHNNHIQNTLNHPMLRRATQLTPKRPIPAVPRNCGTPLARSDCSKLNSLAGEEQKGETEPVVSPCFGGYESTEWSTDKVITEGTFSDCLGK